MPTTYAGYSITEDGQVYSHKSNKFLAYGFNMAGYHVVDLQVNKKKLRLLVHRLVAMTFLPNPKHLPIVNHIDANPTNNNFPNLEWCTQKHNMQEARRLGLIKTNGRPYGEKAGNHKLTWEIVRKVREHYKQGSSCIALAKIYGVERTTITRVVFNRTWKTSDDPELYLRENTK